MSTLALDVMNSVAIARLAMSYEEERILKTTITSTASRFRRLAYMPSRSTEIWETSDDAIWSSESRNPEGCWQAPKQLSTTYAHVRQAQEWAKLSNLSYFIDVGQVFATVLPSPHAWILFQQHTEHYLSNSPLTWWVLSDCMLYAVCVSGSICSLYLCALTPVGAHRSGLWHLFYNKQRTNANITCSTRADTVIQNNIHFTKNTKIDIRGKERVQMLYGFIWGSA